MRYYFHPDMRDKSNRQGFIMEDKERRLIYEAILTKNSIFKPCMYDFINHLSGGKKTYAMGHNVQKSEGVTVGSTRISQIYDSHFKIDGVNNWEFFESQGYEINIQRNKLAEEVTLYRGGELIAKLESAGKDLFEDNADSGKGLLGSLSFGGNYRVDCEDKDLDIAFLLCFALTRTAA